MKLKSLICLIPVLALLNGCAVKQHLPWMTKADAPKNHVAAGQPSDLFRPAACPMPNEDEFDLANAQRRPEGTLAQRSGSSAPSAGAS